MRRYNFAELSANQTSMTSSSGCSGASRSAASPSTPSSSLSSSAISRRRSSRDTLRGGRRNTAPPRLLIALLVCALVTPAASQDDRQHDRQHDRHGYTARAQFQPNDHMLFINRVLPLQADGRARRQMESETRRENGDAAAAAALRKFPFNLHRRITMASWANLVSMPNQRYSYYFPLKYDKLDVPCRTAPDQYVVDARPSSSPAAGGGGARIHIVAQEFIIYWSHIKLKKLTRTIRAKYSAALRRKRHKLCFFVFARHARLATAPLKTCFADWQHLSRVYKRRRWLSVRMTRSDQFVYAYGAGCTQTSARYLAFGYWLGNHTLPKWKISVRRGRRERRGRRGGRRAGSSSFLVTYYRLASGRRRRSNTSNLTVNLAGSAPLVFSRRRRSSNSRHHQQQQYDTGRYADRYAGRYAELNRRDHSRWRPIKLNYHRQYSQMPCQRRELRVNIKEMNWYNVITPNEIDVGRCQGHCFDHETLNKLHSTTHAVIKHQLFMNSKRAHAQEVKGPCCVPYKYQSTSLIFHKDNITVSETFPQMVVESCQCI